MRSLNALPIIFFIAFTVVLLTVFPLHALDPLTIRDAGPPIVTDDSVIFRYKSEKAIPRYVMVNGGFNNWEDPLLMTKNRHDVFVYVFNRKKEKSVVIDKGQYTYRYLVDGVWVRDPANKNILYDGYGTELSYFDVNEPIIIAEKNPVPAGRNDYVFYYKNRLARQVFIVGDFNNWNPYSHPMNRNQSGLWEVVLDIPAGSYLYRFIVDGAFRTDPLNRNLVKDKFENEYSLLKLPLE